MTRRESFDCRIRDEICRHRREDALEGTDERCEEYGSRKADERIEPGLLRRVRSYVAVADGGRAGDDEVERVKVQGSVRVDTLDRFGVRRPRSLARLGDVVASRRDPETREQMMRQNVGADDDEHPERGGRAVAYAKQSPRRHDPTRKMKTSKQLHLTATSEETATIVVIASTTIKISSALVALAVNPTEEIMTVTPSKLPLRDVRTSFRQDWPSRKSRIDSLEVKCNLNR